MFLQTIKNWIFEKNQPNIVGNDLDNLEEEETLKLLHADFVELLKFYCRQDKEKYFQAGNERARLIIRGQYLRTLHLLRKIEKIKITKVGEKEPETKIVGRYGV